MVQEEQTGSTQVQGRVELVHDDEMMDVDDVVAGVHCDALEDDEVRHDDQESVMEEAVEQVEVSHDNTVLEDNDVDNALDDHIDEVSHSVVSGDIVDSNDDDVDRNIHYLVHDVVYDQDHEDVQHQEQQEQQVSGLLVLDLDQLHIH